LATFSGLGVSGLVGNYAIAFSSGSLTGATSGSISVTAGVATHLGIATQPGGAASGSAFQTQPVIQLRDAQGNAVSASGVTVNVTIGSGPGGASLIGSTSASTDGAGIAAFSGLGLSGSVGSYTLSFTATGLTGVSSGAFTLGPGAPAALTIQTQPAGAVSGSPFTTQPSVLVRDAQNNAVGAGVSVSASIGSGPGGTLVGSTTASTAANGVATFSGLGLSGPVGNYTIDFSAGGAPAVSSAALALAAGAAAQLAITVQPPASSANGSALSTAPSVELRDGAGNPVATSGTPVSVALVGAGAALGGTTSTTTTAGVASFPGLVITGTVGSYSLAFSSPGLAGVTLNSISLTPGAPTQLAMAVQPPAVTPGGALSPSPAVQLRDGSGNAVAQPNVTITATLNGSNGYLVGPTSQDTDGSGLATFSGLGIAGTNGTFSITFAGPGLTDVTSSSVALVLPATQLVVTAEPSPNANSGVVFGAQPSVELRDVNNALVTQSGVAVTATLGSGTGSLFGTTTVNTVNGVATFTNLGISGLVGTFSISFSASGLTGAGSAPISLAAGAASQLTFTTAPPANAANGVPFSPQPVLQLRDAAGNAVGTAGVTVTASRASGPNGVTVSGSTATTDGNGTASFGSLSLTGPANTYTLQFSASAPGVTPITSGGISLAPFEFQDAVALGRPRQTGTAAGSIITQRVFGVDHPLVTITADGPAEYNYGNRNRRDEYFRGASTQPFSRGGPNHAAAAG
jgi:hypothetical protein